MCLLAALWTSYAFFWFSCSSCVTVSSDAGAATACSSAILAQSYNPPEYGTAAVVPVQKVRTCPFSLPRPVPHQRRLGQRSGRAECPNQLERRNYFLPRT